MKKRTILCNAGIKTCKGCGTIYYGTTICPACGKEYKEEK